MLARCGSIDRSDGAFDKEDRDMVSMVGSLTILIAMSSTGGIFFHRNPDNHVQPPLPGYGAGYPNGNPDGYGYYDHGVNLPLTTDRTPEYYFPRYLAVPATQSYLPNYYNPYVSRGQRYIPFTGCGGPHPASGPPQGSAMDAISPYKETLNETPRVTAPRFSGRVEAPPVNPGSTGLRP
jgi:hypothetical protein